MKRVLTLAAALGMLIASGGAVAQQFVEESTTRFPQPDPLDYSNQLSIADIDGDGDLDIVWANGQGYSTSGASEIARIYINNGSGVFTDESVARGAAAGHFRGVEFGDADGDGDLDMALADDFNHIPRLLINDGTGHFTDESATRLPQVSLSSTRAQFGDIDNDGDLDLYFTNAGATNRFGSGQNRIYVNDGTGHFTDETAIRHPVAVLAEPQDAIFGDIDGDFDLDIRTASTANNMSRLYRNDGTGIFTTVTGVPPDNNAYSYDFGDIDGDGDLDLLGANAGPSGNNTELLLRNDGAGGYTNVSSQISPNPTTDDNDSKFFDYDNDGDLDLIVAHLGSPAERIYNNNGAGTFTQVSGLITSIADSSLDVKVADLDGDGRIDIVTAQGESGSFRNRIYMNKTGPVDTRPPRIISTEQLPDTANTVGPYVVRAAILDGMSSDRNFFDRGIFLQYAVTAGPPQQVAMRYSGGQIYRGVIPGQPCGGIVAYSVTATDFAGNTGTGPTLTFTIAPPPARPADPGPNVSADPSGEGIPEAADMDNDGVPDGLDCAVCDYTAFAIPAEVGGVAFQPDRVTLSWSSQAPSAGLGTVYDVVRGSVAGGLPVGNGVEICLRDNSSSTNAADTSTPAAPGDCYWYLVRGENHCGEGTYGTTSAGAPRLTATCP